jgi:trk system potassium uptake protein TrkA
MKTLPLRECDYAVVAIGEDFGASVMTTALLKKAGVKRIVSRAIDVLHQTVIETIGVDLVMQPEKESAVQLANRLVFSGIRNSFPVASGFRIVEYQLPGRFTGLKLKEVNFIRTYGLQPITIIRNKEEKSLFSKPKQVPETSGLLSGEEVLAAGDILLLFGSDKAIADLAGRDE